MEIWNFLKALDTAPISERNVKIWKIKGNVISVLVFEASHRIPLRYCERFIFVFNTSVFELDCINPALLFAYGILFFLIFWFLSSERSYCLIYFFFWLTVSCLLWNFVPLWFFFFFFHFRVSLLTSKTHWITLKMN